MSTESERYQSRMALRRWSGLGRRTARAITINNCTADEVCQLTNYSFDSSAEAEAFWDGLEKQLQSDRRQQDDNELDDRQG